MAAHDDAPTSFPSAFTYSGSLGATRTDQGAGLRVRPFCVRERRAGRYTQYDAILRITSKRTSHAATGP